MHPLVLLAKLVVENYIKDYNPPTASSRLRRAPRKIISSPDDLPKKFLKKKSGTFVTIYKMQNTKYELRGCIGTYLPTRVNIAEEIIHNAIAAATEDYRFGPIQKEELPYLSYTVYILSYPELVKDIKDPTKFSEEKFRRAGLNPKKFGIIVKTTPFAYPNEDVVFDGHAPFKSGLLLPDLDGIDTIEKQISIACQKGGINPTREQILIYRFSVEKFI